MTLHPTIAATALALACLLPAGALAGTVTLRSSQFSAERPVPHFQYEGPYQLVEQPSGLAISYCALPTVEADLRGDADIALYYGPGIEGPMRPGTTFFHRPQGWSTLGTGGRASQRIFQKGTIGHFFLEPAQELGGALALAWRLIGNGQVVP